MRESQEQQGTYLEIVVWQRARLPARLCHLAKDPQEGDRTFFPEMGGFFEEVYAWRTKEYVWGSISDSGRNAQVRERLLTSFSPSRPPPERTMAELRCFLDEHKELASETLGVWSECETTEAGQEDATLRSNVTLAFLGHLEWLWSVYRDVPEANITVR